MASSKIPQTLYDGFALDGEQLSPKEFTKLCYSLGYFLTPNEVELAFVLIDGDGDGKISREGWCDCYSLPIVIS